MSAVRARSLVPALLLLLPAAAGCQAPVEYAVTLLTCAEKPDDAYRRHVGYHAERDDEFANTPRQAVFRLGLLTGGGRVVLVNTGLAPSERRLKSGAVRGFVDPVATLRAAGHAPEDVTDIVFTEVTWSTIGNLTRFPRARVWVQRDELDFLRASAHKKLLAAARKDGRLRLVDGAAELFPGVRVRRAGRVTPGNQVVLVDTARGPVAFLGVLAPFQENLTHRSGPPFALTRYGATRALVAVLDEHPGLIAIPGRDPATLERLAQPGPNRYEVVRHAR